MIVPLLMSSWQLVQRRTLLVISLPFTLLPPIKYGLTSGFAFLHTLQISIDLFYQDRGIL